MIQTWQPGMFERPCYGCTMCCKLPAAPEIQKPSGVWCQHCDKGKGCRIYDTRPAGCRDFMCLWKVQPTFPEAERPDKAKVIWQLTQDGATAVATTEYPKALQTAAQRYLISQFMQQGIAVRVNLVRAT